jgi:hypothetical protein
LYSYEYEKELETSLENEYMLESRVYPNSLSAYYTIYDTKRVLRFSTPGDPQYEKANATLPTGILAEKMPGSPIWTNGGDPYGLNNFTVSVVAAHPVVGVQGWSPRDDSAYYGWTAINASSSLRYWKDDWTSLETLPDLQTLVGQVSDVDQVKQSNPGDNTTEIWFSPVWMPSLEPGSHSWIGIFFNGKIIGVRNESTQLKPGLLSSMIEDPKATVDVNTYTVSAYWNTDEVHMFGNEGLITLIQTSQLSPVKPSNPRMIALNFTDADTMYSAAFNQFVGSTQLLKIGKKAPTLAAALAVTLSRIPWLNYDAFSAALSQEIQTGLNQVAFRFITTKHGYGYGTRSTSVYLAMAVILAYCVITVIYILYTLITGSASNAWSSGIELVTLALQSKKPDHLGHTSVGVDSIKTLSESVGVRVNVDNELELVFAHDRDFETRNLRKIARNKEY